MAKTEALHIDVRPHIAGVVRPGDTLILTFNHQVTEEFIEQLREDFKELTDKGIAVAVIEDVAEMVIARFGPDEADLDKEFPDGA